MGGMKRIIIIGSRRRNEPADYEIVKEAFLNTYEKGDIIVSGGCHKGGDYFAELLSGRYDVPAVIWPAEWTDKDGIFCRWAGFARNTIVANNGDVVIACVASDRTGGTEDTLKKFKKFKPDGEIILCQDKIMCDDFWHTNEEIGDMWFNELKEELKEDEDQYIPPHSQGQNV